MPGESGTYSSAGERAGNPPKHQAAELTGERLVQMGKDIVSRATRRAFQNSYSDFSVLREIANGFDDAGVEQRDLPEGSVPMGQRRTLVEEYYATVDWTSPADVRRVLDAYETHLIRLEGHSREEELEKLIKHLSRDGIGYLDGRLVFAVPHQEILEGLADGEVRVDLKHIRVSATRIKDAIDSDPAVAIGSAKELVEATCKAILKERGKEVPGKPDLPKLARAVAEELELVPEGVAEGKKGADHIRKVLGSLAQVIQGLAELRNLYGTGHAQEGGLQARHARLCAGAASTVATFLVETDRLRYSEIQDTGTFFSNEFPTARGRRGGRS